MRLSVCLSQNSCLHYLFTLAAVYVYVSYVCVGVGGGGACGHVFCPWLYTMVYFVDSTFTVYFTAGGHKARGGMKLGGRLHWGVGVLAGTGYG